MSRPLDRQTLESMNRIQLQKLCKDNNIRANLKTEALVESLVDKLQLRTHPPPVSKPSRIPSLPSTTRSTAGTSSRTASGGSVTARDVEEDSGGRGSGQRPAIQARVTVPITPHTRRRRQQEYKVGTGRVKLTAGAEARGVAQSVSLPPAARRRSIKGVKATDVGPFEEEQLAAPVAGPSGSSHELPNGIVTETTPQMPPLVTEVRIDGLPEQIMQPFQEQLQTLQTELQRVSTESADVPALTAKLEQMTLEVQDLRSQMAAMSNKHINLETQMQMLRDTIGVLLPESVKRAGKARAVPITAMDHASPASPASESVIAEADSGAELPLAETLLGKHFRDSASSSTSGGSDVGSEEVINDKKKQDKGHQLVKSPKRYRPARKRVKVSTQRADPPLLEVPVTPPRRNIALESRGESSTPRRAHGAPTFTVFSGPEEPPETYMDNPASHAEFLDLPPAAFSTPIASSGRGPTTTTANANENVQQSDAFHFGFTNTVFRAVPATPTGPYGVGMPSFAYPEPPTSPTPGASTMPSGGYIERAGGRRERNDLFHPYGAPRRSRRSGSLPPPRTPHAGSSAEETAHAHMLSSPMQTDRVPERSQDAPTISSNIIGQGLGMATFPMSPDAPALPMRRTMYGTELDCDTRFGDFGVEGVATGFWTGAAPGF
ncbi:uncharacterized protein LAESUDRAFT_759005 [Laetiporus sulphureus 93-53]|uniref:Uncharacterized protein n=1 Tax=Laetiporus sulphureus 93-53 TaxID=1314785 RepID=A0A165EDU4_9APHY|nr:uncharacterized protein LAESUDRAFT_759005 [Laetiporus sulphureus 93-53]KZT06827.1 hypothetical protein LAESUDRAFT_759005 [Laetiporus sulphureus 93-53]